MSLSSATSATSATLSESSSVSIVTKAKNRCYEAASKLKAGKKFNVFFKYAMPSQFGKKTEREMHLVMAKEYLLKSLSDSGGDTTTPQFEIALEEITKFYDPSSFDARIKYRQGSKEKPFHLEGSWVTLSKPKFKGCLGKNRKQDYTYTLGQMSFGMFCPTQLICSIQGTFNPIRDISAKEAVQIEHVPQRLKDELRKGRTVTRSYDIVTAFSIEPYNLSMGSASPNIEVDERIEGTMTTCGYFVPHPEKPNRISIWFTGGALEVNCKFKNWKKVFGGTNGHRSKRRFIEKAQVIGAKLLMGAVTCDSMNDQGKMYYHFTRPIGGHDTAYADILYLDETLRIVRTNSGAVYVFARMAESTGI